MKTTLGRVTCALLLASAAACGSGANGEAQGASPEASDAPVVDRCAGVVCAPETECTEAETCNPQNGQCQGGQNKPNGTACNDGNACTTGETCRAGTCQGGSR